MSNNPAGKIVAFVNQKGGVGKSTLTTNIAAILGTKYRVMLLDTDSQGSSEDWGVARINKLQSENKLRGFSKHYRGIKKATEVSTDLEEIAAHIASERPSAVEGVIDAVESACRLVAAHPGVGRARDEVDEGVMSFPIGAYIIFYYLDVEPFGIARILHGSRDLPTAFHDISES